MVKSRKIIVAIVLKTLIQRNIWLKFILKILIISILLKFSDHPIQGKRLSLGLSSIFVMRQLF